MTTRDTFIQQCSDDLKAFMVDGPAGMGKSPEFFPLLRDEIPPYDATSGQSATVANDPAQPEMRENTQWESATI